MDNIIVYSKDGCMKCKMLKQKLDDSGIQYENVQDIEEMKKLGLSKLPVMSVDGVLFSYNESINWLNERGN